MNWQNILFFSACVESWVVMIILILWMQGGKNEKDRMESCAG